MRNEKTFQYKKVRYVAVPIDLNLICDDCVFFDKTKEKPPFCIASTIPKNIKCSSIDRKDGLDVKWLIKQKVK